MLLQRKNSLRTLIENRNRFTGDHFNITLHSEPSGAAAISPARNDYIAFWQSYNTGTSINSD